MQKLLIALSINIATVTATLAQPFYVGLWVSDPAACVDESYMLEFSETTFFGYEDTCQLTNPVNIRDMEGVLFDATCRGEGGDSTSRMLVMRETDDRVMLHHNRLTTILETCE